MYKFFVRQMVRRAYRQMSEGDYEAVLKQFGPATVFEFAGSHELGGERRGVTAIRPVFERIFDRFPDLRLEPHAIVVNGMPWNTTVAVRFRVRATVNGEPYANEGVQFLRLSWGRVVEDRLYEDTQKLATALERIARSRATPAPAATV
jgi:ketosteroid isomerase-like protein